jgi:hypothetical protein
MGLREGLIKQSSGKQFQTRIFEESEFIPTVSEPASWHCSREAGYSKHSIARML